MANEQIKLSEQDDKELNSFLSEMIDAGASDTDIESFTTDFIKKKSQAKAPTTPSESQTADGGANLLGRAMQGVGQQLQPTETSGTKATNQPQTDIAISKEREIDNFGKAPLMSDLQDMAVQTSKVPIANQQEMRDRGTHAAINLPKAPLMGDLNDITRSATGATQAGQYQVDGVSVRPDQLNKMLFDDEFVDKLQNGQTEVVVPKEDESLNLLIERQKNAGTRVGDAWNSLKAGATDLAAGLVGIESYAANLMRTIPGFEDMKKSPSEFVAEVGADKLKDMAVKERDKIRAYEGGFIDEVKNGNIGNASSMTANMFAESLAYMASIAATQGAGLVPSLGTLAAVGASSEFAGSDDLDLTNRQKIARATAYGAAESAFSTMPTFGVFSKNLNIAKGLLRGAVKETAKQAGEGAAKQMAKELAEKTAAQGLREIGIDMGKEVGGEMLTTLTQMGTDDYLGVQDYTAEDYKKQLLETGALTLAMGVGMTSLSQIKVVKKLIDSSIKEDKGVTIKSAISDAVMKGAVDAAQGERLASAIQPRIDAINNLPPEVVNDVDMVDKVANISALELKLKEADDMAKPFIEAELNEARKQVPIPFPNKYVDSGGKNASELKDGQLYISFDGEVKKWDATKEEFVKQPKPKKEKNDIDSFVNRMKSGEKFTEAEDLQFYKNNKDEIESKLKADTEVKVDEVAPEVVEEADALGSVESTVYHGGSVTDLNSISENEPFFVTQSESEAIAYSKGNEGHVSIAKLDLSKIAKEEVARGILEDMGYPDEYMIHELVDPRFEDSYIGEENVKKLYSELKKQGYEGVEFTDSGIANKNYVTNILLISPKKTLEKSDIGRSVIVSERRAYELLNNGYFPIINGKIVEDATEQSLSNHFTKNNTVKMVNAKSAESLLSKEQTPKTPIVKDEKGKEIDFYHSTPFEFEDFDMANLGKNTNAESAKEGVFFSNNKNVAESYRKQAKYDNPNINEAEKQLDKLTTEELISLSEKILHGRSKSYYEGYNKKDIVNDIIDDIKEDSQGFYPDRNKYVEKLQKYLQQRGVKFEPYIEIGKQFKVKLKMKNPFVYDANEDYAENIELTKIIKQAKKEGHDGVIIKNVYDSVSFDEKGNDTELSDIAVVFDVSQIVKPETPIVAEKAEVENIEPPKEKSVFQTYEETKGASKQDKVLEDYAKANPEKAERVREIIDNFDAMKQRITQLIDEKKITNLKIEC